LDFGSLGFAKRAFWKIRLLDRTYSRVGERALLSLVRMYVEGTTGRMLTDSTLYSVNSIADVRLKVSDIRYFLD
jgi:hypothetical protein